MAAVGPYARRTQTWAVTDTWTYTGTRTNGHGHAQARAHHTIGVDLGGSSGTCPPIIEKRPCIYHFIPPSPQYFGLPTQYFGQVYASAPHMYTLLFNLFPKYVTLEDIDIST